MDRETLAVLVDEGVGGVPDPPQTVALSCRCMKQLDVVEDGFGGVF